jgi:hypothetical protein
MRAVGMARQEIGLDKEPERPTVTASVASTAEAEAKSDGLPLVPTE